MIFREAALPGVFVIEPEPREDNRGCFARTWCQREFAQQCASATLKATEAVTEQAQRAMRHALAEYELRADWVAAGQSLGEALVS